MLMTLPVLDALAPMKVLKKIILENNWISCWGCCQIDCLVPCNFFRMFRAYNIWFVHRLLNKVSNILDLPKNFVTSGETYVYSYDAEINSKPSNEKRRFCSRFSSIAMAWGKKYYIELMHHYTKKRPGFLRDIFG